MKVALYPGLHPTLFPARPWYRSSSIPRHTSATLQKDSRRQRKVKWVLLLLWHIILPFKKNTSITFLKSLYKYSSWISFLQCRIKACFIKTEVLFPLLFLLLHEIYLKRMWRFCCLEIPASNRSKQMLHINLSLRSRKVINVRAKDTFCSLPIVAEKFWRL